MGILLRFIDLLQQKIDRLLLLVSLLLNLDFKVPLGQVSYHVPCHLRVQNIGLKTKEMLERVPDTVVKTVERCSGHDGTYAVKAETYDKAKKIAKPVVKRVIDSEPDEFGSDCPMAGRLIAEGVEGGEAKHPVSMVRQAYGI